MSDNKVPTVTDSNTEKKPDQENKLTVDQVKNAVPLSLRNSVNQELVNKLNALGNEPEEGKLIRDNFLSYSDILRSGKYKTQDYVNAVLYVSYKIMGRTNQEAYFLTFPDRHAHLLAKGSSDKDISAYVAAFNRGTLVQQMLDRAMIPSWLLNQDVYQEAVNTQLELMRTAKSERVRFLAADSLMTHLGKPENVQTGVNININSYTGLDDLTEKLQELSLAQKKAIQLGASTKDIAEAVLVGTTDTAVQATPEPEDLTVTEGNYDRTESAAEIAGRLFR